MHLFEIPYREIVMIPTSVRYNVLGRRSIPPPPTVYKFNADTLFRYNLPFNQLSLLLRTYDQQVVHYLRTHD